MRKVDNRVNMAKALERSLDMLGEPSKKALLFPFCTLKIPLDRRDCSLEEIGGALKQILAEGASLVLASINSQLEQKTK